jgi:Tfp pilus tip-associated adhesin PilY1
VSELFGNVRTLSSNDVDYAAATPENLDGGKKGWFNNLDPPAAGDFGQPEFPGERAIRNIQLRGGIVFVNSIIPRSDQSCVDVAGGFVLAFCPGTGGQLCFADEAVFDLNNDGVFDDSDGVGNPPGIVAGLRYDEIPTDAAFIGTKRITQLNNEDVDIMSTNTGRGLHMGRLSWKQLDAIQ